MLKIESLPPLPGVRSCVPSGEQRTRLPDSTWKLLVGFSVETSKRAVCVCRPNVASRRPLANNLGHIPTPGAPPGSRKLLPDWTSTITTFLKLPTAVKDLPSGAQARRRRRLGRGAYRALAPRGIPEVDCERERHATVRLSAAHAKARTRRGILTPGASHRCFARPPATRGVCFVEPAAELLPSATGSKRRGRAVRLDPAQRSALSAGLEVPGNGTLLLPARFPDGDQEYRTAAVNRFRSLRGPRRRSDPRA